MIHWLVPGRKALLPMTQHSWLARYPLDDDKDTKEDNVVGGEKEKMEGA